jgi:hypothetical protein
MGIGRQDDGDVVGVGFGAIVLKNSRDPDGEPSPRNYILSTEW